MLDFGFYNMDCMEGMREFPDKYFDLAIVDPPYGDGGGVSGRTERDSGRGSTGTRIHQIHNAGAWSQMGGGGPIRTGGTWAAKFGKKLSRGI